MHNCILEGHLAFPKTQLFFLPFPCFPQTLNVQNGLFCWLFSSSEHANRRKQIVLPSLKEIKGKKDSWKSIDYFGWDFLQSATPLLSSSLFFTFCNSIFGLYQISSTGPLIYCNYGYLDSLSID